MVTPSPKIAQGSEPLKPLFDKVQLSTNPGASSDWRKIRSRRSVQRLESHRFTSQTPNLASTPRQITLSNLLSGSGFAQKAELHSNSSSYHHYHIDHWTRRKLARVPNVIPRYTRRAPHVEPIESLINHQPTLTFLFLRCSVSDASFELHAQRPNHPP